MPYKKGSVAYQAMLARRRANRRINNLKKEIAKVGGVGTYKGSELQAEINRIEKWSEGTRQYSQAIVNGRKVNVKRNGKSENEIKQQLSYIESRLPSTETFRKNMQTISELNKPFRKDGISGKYSEMEVRAFFAATRRAWQGRPHNERIKNIMEYYQVSDLREFVDEVLGYISSEIDEDELLTQMQEYQEMSKRDDNDQKSYPSIFPVLLNDVSQLSRNDYINNVKGNNYGGESLSSIVSNIG